MADYRAIDGARFGKIKDKKKKIQLEKVHNIIFEIDLVNQVKQQIEMIEPICELILKSQKKKYSMGEFVKHWTLLPSKYSNFDRNVELKSAVEKRDSWIVTDKSLTAYALLPETDFFNLNIKIQQKVDT